MQVMKLHEVNDSRAVNTTENSDESPVAGAIADQLFPGGSAILDLLDSSSNNNMESHYEAGYSNPTIADSQRMIQDMAKSANKPVHEEPDTSTKNKAKRNPYYIAPEAMSGVPKKPKPENA